MAYLYRNQHSSGDEPQFSNFSTNPLSPPRNPNRLSGGMVNSHNDARIGLTRRFTMNALPTLSPIGQQRRQAAGESQAVSLNFTLTEDGDKHRSTLHSNSNGNGTGIGARTSVGDGLSETGALLVGSEPSPGMKAKGKIESGREVGAQSGTEHKRGNGRWGSIGDGRLVANTNVAGEGFGEIRPLGPDDTLIVNWLTPDGKPAAVSRVGPVSSFLPFTSVLHTLPAHTCTSHPTAQQPTRQLVCCPGHPLGVDSSDISRGQLVLSYLARS